MLFTLYPQVSQEVNSRLHQFKLITTAEQRFEYFYADSDRYATASAYRWQELIRNLIKDSEQSSDVYDKQRYQTMMVTVYYDLGDYENAALLVEELLQKKSQLDHKVKIRLLHNADKVYAALQFFNKQLEIRKELKNSGEQVVLYDIYSNLGLYRHALMDYGMVYHELETEGTLLEKAVFHNDKGTFLRKDGSVYSAYKEYVTGLEFVETFIGQEGVISEKEFRKAVNLKGSILGNMGKCKMDQGKYEEAIPYIEAGISASKKFDKGKFSTATVNYWSNLAECYLNTNSPELARTYLDSIDLTYKNPYLHLVNYNRIKAKLYLKENKPDSATFFLNSYMKTKDSIEYSDMRKQLLGQLVAFDIDVQTKRKLEQQRLDLERNRSEILEREKTIYLSIVALVFSVLCVFALIIAYVKSIKNKRLIENQKRIIENSLTEKDSLLKEIHHRVKNNLQMVSSLLSLQAKNTRSRAAINALEEGQSRVKAMALIHQKLYQNEDLSVIEMQEYIESLIASIQSVYKKDDAKVNIIIDAKGTQLDVDRAIPIGLILNELVSNSFKYAFTETKSGHIKIKLTDEGEHVAFEYSDDGIGLPDDFETVSTGSMGLNLINRLANQLRSKLQIDRDVKGVRFWFNFS
ncbi:histidine kinase dimerization/phosphoacceptor domain -containing protein [Robertkochia solimangrovi]|uniref:histidine kinase dimerization/phosphoacceptor domain -containing protein n=1 Tax=Robertkochia solimangrovi TaxID=2213046 RepID=UPI0013A5A4C9|nr:histidine kinase dimerization/phosphoacceptor domain -containing protein [Robertkochia solimangrovi]